MDLFDVKTYQMNSASVKALLTANEARNETSRKLEDEKKERDRVAEEYTERYIELCVQKLGSDIDFDVKHGHTGGTYDIQKRCGITRIPPHHTDTFNYGIREVTECKSLYDIIARTQTSVMSWPKQGGLDVSIEPPTKLPEVSDWTIGYLAFDDKCPNRTLRWYIK